MLHPITFGVVGRQQRYSYEYGGDAGRLTVNVLKVLSGTVRWKRTEIMCWNGTAVGALNSKRYRVAKIVIPDDFYPDFCTYMNDGYRRNEPIVLACVEALQYVAEKSCFWNGSEPLKIVVAPYEKTRYRRQIRTGHYRTKWNKWKTGYERVWKQTSVPVLMVKSPAWHVENEWVLK